MKYYVYVLESKTTGQYYIGHSKDVDGRLKAHNNGFVRPTKAGRPWNIRYIEQHETRSQAM